MYLTPGSLVPFLIGRGLIDTASIVRGDIQIAELERNNRCFKVVSKHADSFFVKQIREHEDNTVTAIRREAAVYQLAASDRSFEPLARLLPKFFGFDESRHTVIVEFLGSSENVHQFHNRISNYPVEIGRVLGQSLSVFHSELGRQFSAEMPDSLFQRQPPWILSFHRDQGDGQLSPANQQLLQMLRADSEMQQILDHLLTLWRFDGLIHRDLKWNNILLVRSNSESGSPDRNDSDSPALSVRILDWELADLGDWCWDAGMMLQNWYSFEALAGVWQF
jgi:thiamine kinase-like enzyme